MDDNVFDPNDLAALLNQLNDMDTPDDLPEDEELIASQRRYEEIIKRRKESEEQ